MEGNEQKSESTGPGGAGLTFGEKAAGVSFNPGGNPDVDKVKRLAANLIDEIHQLRLNCKVAEQARYFSAAITEIEKGQMLAVKAITWQY